MLVYFQLQLALVFGRCRDDALSVYFGAGSSARMSSCAFALRFMHNFDVPFIVCVYFEACSSARMPSFALTVPGTCYGT